MSPIPMISQQNRSTSWVLHRYCFSGKHKKKVNQVGTALQLQTPLRGSSPLSAAVVSCSAGGKPELTPAQNKKSNDIPTASFTSLYIDLHCMIYHGWWGILDFVCCVSHQQHPVSASPLLQISYGALELFGLEVLGQPAEIPKITFWLVVIVNGYSLPIMELNYDNQSNGYS